MLHVFTHAFPLQLAERPFNAYANAAPLIKVANSLHASTCEESLRIIARLDPKAQNSEVIAAFDSVLEQCQPRIRHYDEEPHSTTNEVALIRCVRRCANFILLRELFDSVLIIERAARVQDKKDERFYCLYDVIEYGGRARGEHRYHTNHRSWSAGVAAWRNRHAALLLLLDSEKINMHKGHQKVSYFIYPFLFVCLANMHASILSTGPFGCISDTVTCCFRLLCCVSLLSARLRPLAHRSLTMPKSFPP